MIVLQIVLLVCLACSWVYWVLCVYAARCWYINGLQFERRGPSLNSTESVPAGQHPNTCPAEIQPLAHTPTHPIAIPPLTILKPLRGTDPEQYANFKSFCDQQYPEFQIVFGALDPNDEGLQTAAALKRDRPDTDISIVAGGEGFGLNLKVCNLQNMLGAARYEYLVISDSDMRVGPDYLQRIMAPFQDPKVGLVTCPYRGHLAEGFASKLEALGIGADFMPSVMLTARVFGMAFAFGSTIVIRRDVLDQIGGLPPLADELADDYLLGNKTKAAGYEVVLSDYVVGDVLRRESFKEMWTRRLRWARTTCAMHPLPYLGAVITHTTGLGLLYLAASGAGVTGWTVLALSLCIRGLSATWISSRYLSDRSLPAGLLWLPVSDLVGFALWAGSFLGNTVEWRGCKYRVKNGGKLSRL